MADDSTSAVNPVPSSPATDSKPTMGADSKSNRPSRGLSMWDAASIVVGTIIGSAIFRLPPVVAMQVDSLAWFAAAWILGGLIAYCGALCFAELTTTYNEDGGDYIYLREAFGRYVGFLFAWTAGWIIRPANVGAMAATFAMFAEQAIGQQFPAVTNGVPYFNIILAIVAVVALSACNLQGIELGRWTQNVLTTCKVAGLLILVTIGLWPLAAQTDSPAAEAAVTQISQVNTESTESETSMVLPDETKTGNADTASVDTKETENATAEGPTEQASPSQLWTRLQGLSMALVFVLFTFGGWNDVSFVAAEIRSPQRNLPKALLLGLSVVTLIYLLVNWTLISNLGLGGLAEMQNAPAAVVGSRMEAWGWGSWATVLLAILVSVSCLGAVNAMLITSPRIYYAAGKDHSALAWFARWDHRTETPVRALVAQTIATIVMLVACGAFSTKDDPFEELVAVSSPFFWAFLALVGVGLIVLRFTDSQRNRPIRALGYPITPLIFIASSVFMIYSSVSWAISQKYWISGSVVLTIFVAGLILGLKSRKTSVLGSTESSSEDIPSR